jgi:hypothetical protein
MSAVLADNPPRIRKPITVRPAPRREPPFDDEVTHLRLVGRHDRALPFESWPGRPQESGLWQAVQPTRRGDLPDPATWGRRMLIAVLEARAGRRALPQLAPLLSPGVQAGLARDLARSAASHRQAGATEQRVRSIHVCEPVDGVAELAAVIQIGPRVRAVAARLEGQDGRWRCVRLQIG